LSDKETLADFYRKTIDIIFAFIIGQSFLSIDPLLKSISEIFEFHNVINFLAVSFAYFVLIIGWIAYHKSIMFKPHFGKFGNARYGVDLIVLFVTYYLLRLSKPIGDTQNVQYIQYGEIFLWTLPTLFILYCVWDVLKYVEYSHKSRKRLVISPIFAVGFIIMAIVYHYMSMELTTQEFWENKSSIDIYFLVASIVMVLIYRIWKWDVQGKKPKTAKKPKMN
jgi:hypothetical protein